MSFITFPARIEGLNFRNTGIGFNSLLRVTPAPTTGNANTAYGYNALTFTTTGRFNTAIGSQALEANSTGSSNTAVGDYALQNNISGTFNTALGRGSLSSTDSIGSTGVGANSLLSATGGGNTAIGYGAGSLITTGQNNTVLGPFSGNQGGYDIRTLSNYVVIADGAGNPRIIVDPAGLVSAPGGFSGGGGGGGAITINNKTAAYTVVSGDLGEIINCTANTFTVSLTAAATLGSGFNCWVWNTGTGVITIDPNGAETIDGRSTLILRQGEGLQIVCNGANWETGDKKTMRGYAENIQAGNARPTASGANSVAIGTSGAGASTASGSASVAIGSLAVSGSSFSLALGYDANVNTGDYSSSIGANSAGSGSRATSGAGAMSLGGSYASGVDSFAAAISSNSNAYGAKNTGALAAGNLANSTQQHSIAFGFAAASTGQYSIAFGAFSSASGSGSVALGSQYFLGGPTAQGDSSLAMGDGCATTQRYAVALGGGARSETVGKFANASGYFAQAGDCQTANYTLRRQTADATSGVLTSNASAGSTNNQVVLQNNCAYAFTGVVVARQQAGGGTQSAAWKVEGLIRREGTAASTTLVTSTVTVISNVPAWTLGLSADTTNGALAVTVSGAPAINIRWTASIECAEVIYA